MISPYSDGDFSVDVFESERMLEVWFRNNITTTKWHNIDLGELLKIEWLDCSMDSLKNVVIAFSKLYHNPNAYKAFIY